ncbi:mitochondrial proton/calcium exchanger protein-like protein isoform X1, partial [Tanacetum coccineum]
GLSAIQAQLSNLGREIKKVNEKVYAAQVGCENVPIPGGRFRATAPGFYQRDDGNNSYQERRQTLEESLKSFIFESSKRHNDNNNLIKEIRSSTNDALRNQGASIMADHVKCISTSVQADQKAIRRIGFTPYAVSNEQDRMMTVYNRTTIPFPCHLYADSYDDLKKLNDVGGLKASDLGASVNVMPYVTYAKLGLGSLVPTKLIVELAYRSVKHPKGIVENVLVRIEKIVFPVHFIVLDMPEDITYRLGEQ